MILKKQYRQKELEFLEEITNCARCRGTELIGCRGEGGSWFEAGLDKRPFLNQWMDLVACLCYPSYKGSMIKRIKAQAGPGTKQDPISK
jgi:hypothetical protein